MLKGMNIEGCKSLLIRDKQFLKQMYTGPNVLKNKRILISASDNEINTLLKYLFYVVNGEILINESNFEALKKQKKLKLLQKTLEKKKDYLLIVNGPRTNKINFIIQLSAVLPNLLFGLFNLEPKLRKNGI